MKKITILLFVSFFVFFSQNLFSQTIIFNSEVKGTWTKVNSPYIVLRDITVPEDTSLIIEPGVEVQFATGFGMTVEGNLLAIGNSSDKIIFTSADTTSVKNDNTLGWKGITIPGENTDTSIIENCVIEYVYTKEDSYSSFQSPITVNARHAIINKCIIKKNTGHYGGSIYCAYEADVLILNSIICNNSANYNRGGIYVNQSNVLIANNLISENEIGIYIYGKNAHSDTVRIFNNTIIQNTPFTNYWNNNIIVISGGLARMQNCIVWDNMDTHEELIGVYSLGYALFENCIIKCGKSNVRSENSNTVFNNVYEVNPHFVDFDNMNFQLTDSSYAINTGLNHSAEILALMPDDIAGDPRIFDDAVDKIDIGAYEFQSATIANRQPSINSPGTQHIFISSSREMTFSFSDVDESDSHILSATTDNPNIILSALSAQTNNANYTIDPLPAWSGTANVILTVSDNHGAQDIDTFAVIVNDTINYDITDNVTWDIDTVYIGSSFIVSANATLEIQPGTCIRFMDNYIVEVEGIIEALGSSGNKIRFTPVDTSGFSGNTHKGWGGIVLKNVNDSSVFNNCIFEYVKDRCVFLMNDETSADIVNCVFRNNKAMADYNYPSVIHGEKSTLYIGNSLFYDNQSRYATIMIDEPEIILYNNAFFNNSGIFATVDLRYGGSALIKNCIFWNNLSRDWEIETSSLDNFNISNCIVEGGESVIGAYGTLIKKELIFNVYPQFIDSLNRDFHLLSGSPSINKGVNDAQLAKLNNIDLEGNSRIYNGSILLPDIGAYEYQGEPSNRRPVLEKVEDKTAMLGKPVTGTVNFFDADESDTHTITVQSNNANVMVQNLSGDTTGSVYTLVPSVGFEGSVGISVKVEDNGGLLDSISYNLQVNQMACGSIFEDMVWDADTIQVVCDVIVEEGATLTINPGVKVIFNGPYMLDVYGTLKAEGAAGDTIRFILSDTITFNETVYANAWRGIKLNSVQGQDTSELRYCEIRNSQEGGIKSGYYANAIISNCNIHQNYNNGLGGGIYSYGGYTLIENCYIIHNQSERMGGGIYVENSKGKIFNNVISDNISREQGGGIYSNNYYSTGLIIEGNTIQNNSSTNGGGGGIYSNNDTIRNNIIRNNFSLRTGGGIDAHDNGYIINNIVDGNNGGGICVSYGSFHVINNIVINNYYSNINDYYSKFYGWGIYLSSASGFVANNTICKNTSGDKGNGIYIVGNKSPDLVNNIIWGNKSPVSGSQIHISNELAQPKISYCVVEGGKDSISCSSGVYYTGEYENNIDKYPYFADTTNNDFNLTDSSICINSGIADTTGLNIPGTDIADSARIYNGTVDRIDIGAYEYNGEPVNRPPLLSDMEDITLFSSQTKQMKVEYIDPDVSDTHTLTIESNNPDFSVENISGDTTNSTYDIVGDPDWQGNATIKLRVEDSEGLSDSIYYSVNVNDNVCGDIGDKTVWDKDTIFVSCNVTIPENKTLTIKKGTVVIFEGYYNIEVYGNLIAEGTELDSITFISDDISSSEPDDLWGGIRFRKNNNQDTSKLIYCNIQYSSGIKIYDDNVIVSNCNFNHNYSSNGGGIYIVNSSPLIENCIFTNNSVSNTGGGISCIDDDDFDYTDTYPVIRGNRFISNTASHGGAIYCRGWETKPNITENIFYDNHASYGGGIYLGDDIQGLIIQSNLIIKNTASYDGAGIYFEDDGQTFINNTIANNNAMRNGGGFYCQKYASSSFYNCIIYYNDARENGSQGYLLDKSSDPSFYNCFLQYGLDSITGDGAGNEYDGYFINTISVDPLFADITNNNYQLSDSSFCINAGTMNIKNAQLPALDIAGNPRVFAGVLSNVDVGAYEFQGNPKNRKPIIVSTNDQYTQVSIRRKLSVHFIDVDKTDVHTITVTTNNVNVTVENKSGDVTGSTYELVPANEWEGISEIYVRVEDDKGNYAIDTFNLTVSEFYCGSITENTVWGTDTIKVSCDVTVEENVTLTILPGTVVIFDDYARLKVSGRLLAVGTEENGIIFTSSDASAYPDESYIGWRGIRFYGPGSIDTSKLIYCTIQYAKGSDMNYTADECGGGVFFDDWHLALVANCIIHHNSAVESGGGIYFSGGGMYSSSSHVRFESNIISNNSAKSGGGMYINIGNINSQTNYLINNIICNNSAFYGGGMYCNGIYSFNNNISNNYANYGGGLYIYNNSTYVINSIIWGNVANSSSSSDQIYIDYYSSHISLFNNVIEDGLNGIDSEDAIDNNECLIEQNPEFVSQSSGAGINYNGLTANWSLAANSPCINNGAIDKGYNFEFLPTDINGEERILMDTIDIGPYEFRNFAPVKTGEVPDQQIFAERSCDLDIPVNGAFTDNNIGDVLTYSVSAINPPAWINIEIISDNINITGTPGNNDVGITEAVLNATDLFGEEIADTFEIEVIEGTSIKSITNNQFTIYPVPADDIIYIETLCSNDSECSVEIIDIRGETLKVQSLNIEGRTSIDVSSIPAGLYHLKLRFDKSYKMYKIAIM